MAKYRTEFKLKVVTEYLKGEMGYAALAKGERLAGFIRTLEAQTVPVAEFDERLRGAMVDYVTVGADGGVTVVFRDGTEGKPRCICQQTGY